MLLVVDIGNTHTVIGIMDGLEVRHHWRITSSLARTEDEIGLLVSSYFGGSGYSAKDIDGVAISSVVPDLLKAWEWMSQKYLQKTAMVVTAGLKLDMAITYTNPDAVGADRLCNAVAGIQKYGKPLIILDFGTAITFDCVDASGDYAGGIIAPGIETSISTLHRKAAKLPRVDLAIPDHVVGKTTEESIQVGIMRGLIHMIEGLIADIRQEMGQEARVVATGGLAKMVAPYCPVIEKVDPFLSLEGIVLIYNKNHA